MKISKQKQIELKKKVEDYKNSLGRELNNTPEELRKFNISGIHVGLNKHEQMFVKQYFKELLPYKEWRAMAKSKKDFIYHEVEHWHDFIEGGEN